MRLYRALPFCWILAYVALAPCYQKVEESFNTQAVHDLLYHAWWRRDNIQQHFDHVAFPGIVPRTFIIPCVIAALAFPFRLLLGATGKRLVHLVARLVVGAASAWSLDLIAGALEASHGVVIARAFVVVSCAQFHALYYASRTLPNTFALILTNAALAMRIRRRFEASWILLAVVVALLRSEVVLLLICCLVVDLWPLKNHSLESLVRIALKLFSSALVTAFFSVAVDSYFWQRLSYPELEVFYFNAVLNKSSDWGVSPFHWYFTSALPRALAGAFPLAAFGLVQDPSCRRTCVPFVMFVALYSFLPHKELRFIFYAIPACNVCAATTVATVWTGRSSSKQSRLAWIMSLGILLVSAALLPLYASASYWNYPGGRALDGLIHGSAECEGNSTRGPLRVHIDAKSATTGINRFLERDDGKWLYSKEEDHSILTWVSDFELLVTERPTVDGFMLIHEEPAFRRLRFPKALSWAELSAVVAVEPAIFVQCNTALHATCENLQACFDVKTSGRASRTISGEAKEL
ncbi:Dol-P-Man:Man(7)GlcNAc(2)-PP-Dol alpha-1,6-mannosyltransferase [Porphyridium purpureum]|uniref:Mannosyltransferase n=1 Tax=Porphyridium purpureum TaxID=35688 RepID=A0A5J4Z206_PORPP|nr:Dol-P-Man:Man(7)GlcNAc(2)-PP-Dol alpha-1,6-mannosyltransferase [Porphyridium purpureum]|eukprot:POR3911..scf208_2